MADGFLELGRAPDLNYGVTMVSGRLSARSHTLSDMTIYLHAGSARFNVGSQSYQANTGDMIYIPRGAIYSAYAPDDVKMYMITIYSPPLDANDVEYHERSEGKREGVNISTDIESE